MSWRTARWAGLRNELADVLWAGLQNEPERHGWEGTTKRKVQLGLLNKLVGEEKA